MNDALGDRMKQNYENRSKTFLTRRMPVIIRIDGKAFHTFTRGFKEPYDEILRDSMNQTMKHLCESIQGCKFGYAQSDEISLLLTDYDKLETDAWFNYSVQKLCSVSASIATAAFNKHFLSNYNTYRDKEVYRPNVTEEVMNYLDILHRRLFTALFDARCFNIPKEEVTNCFIWRQQDATRNAIQTLGQCYFSNKELDEKSCNEIQDMLMTRKGVNFNDMPTDYKRGTCCYKNDTGWIIDKEPPIFTKDREYVERWINVEDQEESSI